MSAKSAVYRLSFILPDSLYSTAPRGPMVPCLHGCLLDVHSAGLVSCEGRPLEVVLEQVRRFISGQVRGKGVVSIGATLLDFDRLDTPQSYLISGGGRTVRIEPRGQLPLPGFGDAA